MVGSELDNEGTVLKQRRIDRAAIYLFQVGFFPPNKIAMLMGLARTIQDSALFVH